MKNELTERVDSIFSNSVNMSVALMELASRLDKLLNLITALYASMAYVTEKGGVVSHSEVDAIFQKMYSEIGDHNSADHSKIVSDIMSDSHKKISNLLINDESKVVGIV